MNKESKKTLATFSLASFFHDMGSDMVFSVWPFFVTEFLGANKTVLGLIDGIGDAVVSISQAVSGYISDRIRKRKVFVWLGYLSGALARVGYSISLTWHMVLPFRILDRSGKMRGAPRDAILSDLSTREDRARNFGILRAMDNLGAVCGTIIAMVLLGTLGYRMLFLLAAIPSVLAVLLVYFGVPKEMPFTKALYRGVRLNDLNHHMRLLFLLSAIFSLGTFSYSFLLLYVKSAGVPIIAIPAYYLLFNLVAALFSLPFGTLADIIGRKFLLFISFAFWGCTTLLLIASQHVGVIILAFVSYGLHGAALEPVQKTFVAELAPERFRASILGGFQMVIGLCALPASLFAGFLWDQFGRNMPLYFSLCMTVIASLLLLFVREPHTTASRE